jgi:hypothetical protein
VSSRPRILTFAGLSVADATGIADTIATADATAIATADATVAGGTAVSNVVQTAVVTNTALCSVLTTAIPSSIAASLTGGAAANGISAAGGDMVAVMAVPMPPPVLIFKHSMNAALGELPPAVIESTGDRRFPVNGNTFAKRSAALGHSCDIQHNACANAANSGILTGGVGQCEAPNASSPMPSVSDMYRTLEPAQSPVSSSASALMDALRALSGLLTCQTLLTITN